MNIIADLCGMQARKKKFMALLPLVFRSLYVYVSGMAMKFACVNRAEKLGLDLNAHKPYLVIFSGYQVCWEKFFCVYWISR